MVLPRNHGTRSLTKLLTTLCALNALLIFPAYSAELPASALTSDDGRNLGAQLYVEGAGGSPVPVTWVDDEMHIMSVISVTSDETPDPLYGTDADQPTLPPLLETQEPAAVYQSPPFDDATHEPVTLEPIVLMEPYPPSDVLGDDGSIVDPSPTPCPTKVRAPAPAPSPTPCSSEPAVPDPVIPVDGTGTTETSDITVETPDSTNLTPTPDIDGSEIVVVYTPAADSPDSGSEEPIDVVTDSLGPWEEPAEETQDHMVPTPTSDDTPSTESPEPVMVAITLPGDGDISATTEIPDSIDLTPTPGSDGSDPAVVVVYTPVTDSPDSGSEEPATDSPVPTPEEPVDVVAETPEPADTLDDTTTPVVSPAPIDDTPAPEVVIIIGEETPAPALTPVPGSDVNPRMFATKTAYWDQRDLFIDDPSVQFQRQRTEQELQDLTLLQVQQVNRHGTRFPTKSRIEEILSLTEKLQTKFSDSIPDWLRNYTLPYDVSIEDTLASPGAMEMLWLGARTRMVIGSAVPIKYVKEQFVFQHTYKSRTKDSARSFASAFFINPQDVQYTEYTKKKDRLLRYFDECPRYLNEVKNNATGNPELSAYKESAQMVEHIEFLKTRLDLPADADLTVLDLESTYSACAFDIALYGTYSNWCTLLNKQFVDSLEYVKDLEAFYEQGAGYKINYEIASVLLKDVYAFIKDLIAGKTQVAGNFRFAHAETTLPLMTLLGYGDRTPLLASYTADQVAQRGFRTSILAPLAANIDFRLYQSKADAAKYFVQVLVNEKIAPVPGCGGKVFCELSKVEELWGYYLNEYDFDEDCKVN